MRVLGPGGRALFVVPNRSGLWARRDGTPFGFGRPYSLAQLEAQLKHHGFTPERSQSALFAPPSNRRFWLRTADFWEGDGRQVAPWLAGGVLMVEASQADLCPDAARACARWSAGRCGCWKGCRRRCPRRDCDDACRPDGVIHRASPQLCRIRLPQCSGVIASHAARQAPRPGIARPAKRLPKRDLPVAGCTASATPPPKLRRMPPVCATGGLWPERRFARCRGQDNGRVDVSEPASISTGIAARYATAVFELAKDGKALTALEADIDALDAALADSADLRDADRLAAGQPRRPGQGDRGDCRQDGPCRR